MLWGARAVSRGGVLLARRIVMDQNRTRESGIGHEEEEEPEEEPENKREDTAI